MFVNKCKYKTERKKNVVAAYSNEEESTMHYALCTMHYELCTMHYALCTMHYALCTMHYALSHVSVCYSA